MIRPATLEDLRHVVHNCRDGYRAGMKMHGMGDEPDPELFCVLRLKASTVHYALVDDETGEPICVFGIFLSLGVAYGWMAGSKKMDSMTLKQKKEFVRAEKMLAHGVLNVGAARRVELFVIAGNEQTERNVRFARKLGLTMEENIRHRAGPSGEDLYTFAMWR